MKNAAVEEVTRSDRETFLGHSTGLDARSKELRHRMLKVLGTSGRGHLPSAFSVTEVLRVLYDEVLRFDPKQPHWKERDRLILSKGHGCIALYVFLAEKGFFPESELWQFCKLDGMLGGHPEHKVPGVEASTGSLGHGLPIGIGFALNARYERSPHRTFVIIGDGESDEGSVWEAALCAGKHRLDNLVVLVDYNKCQSYGYTKDVQNLEPLADKWRSFGFNVREIDGHDLSQVRDALQHLPISPGKPSVIICHTVKGKGIRPIECNFLWHHKTGLRPEELEALDAEIEQYEGIGIEH
jgi:transketolase